MALLFIPHIRGYYSWHGDNITHLGFLKDLLYSGTLSNENYYPISHILLTESALIIDAESRFVSNIAPVMLSAISPLFLYLFTKSLYNCEAQRILCLTISSSILIGGVYNVFFMPNGCSIFLLPLALYLLLKRGSIPHAILLLPIIIIYPYFHPLSSLFIIFAILIMWGVSWAHETFVDQSRNPLKQIFTQNPLALILLETTVFITWVLSIDAFENNIRNVFYDFTKTGPEILSEMNNTLIYIGVENWETMVLFLKLQGAPSFMIVLSILGLCLITIRTLKSKLITIYEYRTICFGSVFIIIGSMYATYLLCAPVLENIGAERLITYASLFTPVFMGIVLYKILRGSRLRLGRIMIVVALIFIPAFASGIALYPSPYVFKPNAQIGYQDILGTSWFFNNKAEKVPIFSTLSNQPRIVEGIFGKSNAKVKGFRTEEVNQVPDHFNFFLSSHENKIQTTDSYFSLSMMDRITYLTVWNIIGRFDNNDFDDINSDEAIINAYSNNEYLVYFLNLKNKS